MVSQYSRGLPQDFHNWSLLDLKQEIQKTMISEMFISDEFELNLTKHNVI